MWSGIPTPTGAPPPPPPGQWGVLAQPAQPQQQQQQQQKHDIFVGNLAFSTTEEQLHQAFSELGRIIKVRMVNDLETGKPRGFAFIEFEDPQAALAAIRNMNDYELNGRKIRVNFSNSSHLETLAGKLGMDMSQHTQTKKSGTSTTAGGVGLNAATGTGTDGANGADIGTQAVADALKSMSKGEMYDIIKKLKEIADRDPDEARKLISAHPQLPEAILHLMSKLEMIQTPVNTNVLDISTSAGINVSTGLTPNTTALNPTTAQPPPPPQLATLTTRATMDPRAAAAAAASSSAQPTIQQPPSQPATSARPADPRARADPRAAARQQQSQPPPQQPRPQPPAAPPLMPAGVQVPPPPVPPVPPHMAPPPPPPGYGVGVGVPPPSAPQQQAPPPVPPPAGVAGLDPSLVQQVMGLTPQQIAQLPPDKQQSILALRQRITGSM